MSESGATAKMMTNQTKSGNKPLSGAAGRIVQRKRMLEVAATDPKQKKLCFTVLSASKVNQRGEGEAVDISESVGFDDHSQCSSANGTATTTSSKNIGNSSSFCECKPDDNNNTAEISSSTETPSKQHSSSVSNSEKKLAALQSVSWYKGMKVDKEWLLKHYSEVLVLFSSKVGNRMRTMMKCKLCETYEHEAKKHSSNGTVPLAHGILVINRRDITRIIDHLCSGPHKASVELDKKTKSWDIQSESHPWVKCLKKHRAEVVDILIHLAIDVYNDSVLETLSARSWPARSLAQLQSDRLCKYFGEHGWEAPFQTFGSNDSISSSLYHYRDPNTYREMLGIIAKLQFKQIGKELENCVSFSIQIDGSVDKQQIDSKFVLARYMPKDSMELKTVFIGVFEPENSGAKGLLECVNKAINGVSAPIEKLGGVTTDGESANTGSEAGLWKLLKEQLQRPLLTVWCVCHRTDLALEQIETSVAELKIWKANLKGLATFFRVSKRRTKLLTNFSVSDHDEGEKVLHFPNFSEVRFAEHLKNLIGVSLNNLKWCRMVWRFLVNEGDKCEKAEASGFLKVWDQSALQVWLSALMYDITNIFTSLEKGLQKSCLMITDVATLRNCALQKLKLMKTEPFPGGMEAKYPVYEKNLEDKRIKFNQFVTTSRNFEALRQEVILSAKNFLKQRLNIENDTTLSTVKAMYEAKSCSEFIKACMPLFKAMFGNDSDNVAKFAEEICDQWSIISSVVRLPEGSESGTCQSVYLRNILQQTYGQLRQILSLPFVVSPHSMSTERAVSHYNLIKSSHRQSLSHDTINCRMCICLNGRGTANFDPRPSVAEFLATKDRHYREPLCEIYKERDFVKKFFRDETSL